VAAVVVETGPEATTRLLVAAAAGKSGRSIVHDCPRGLQFFFLVTARRSARVHSLAS
jgi:hypothetical protein